jgi:hypothetical protein
MAPIVSRRAVEPAAKSKFSALPTLLTQQDRLTHSPEQYWRSFRAYAPLPIGPAAQDRPAAASR